MIGVVFLGENVHPVGVLNFALLVLLTIKAVLFFVLAVWIYRWIGKLLTSLKSREELLDARQVEIAEQMVEMRDVLQLIKGWTYSAKQVSESVPTNALAAAVEAMPAKVVEAMKSSDSGEKP